MKVNKSIVGGGFFIVLSAAILLAIPYQIKDTSDALVNAQFLPRAVTWVMLLLSACLFVQGLINAKRGNAEKDTITIQLSDELRVGLTFLLLVVYAIVMPLIGFIISSAAVCGAILLLMKVKMWTYYAYTLAIILITFAIFKYLLNIMLP